MASSLVLRRAIASNLISKLFNPIRAASIAPSVSRSFNTNGQMTNYDEDDRSIEVDRRRSVSLRGHDAPSFFSDVFDPFLAASGGIGAGSRWGWDVKEDKDALYLRIDMPELGIEEVSVCKEQNALMIIKGEGEKELEKEESGRRYPSRIDLPPNLYKINQIKAEMKNGVLNLVVPKVK